MPYNPYCLALVLVTPNGSVNPMMPVSYMTPASAPVPVVSPLSSHLVHRAPLLSPCALGQQVIAYCLPQSCYCLGSLLFDVASLYAIVWTAYCLELPIVSLSPYCDYLHYCWIV